MSRRVNGSDPGAGGGLPTATGAGQLPVSDGAGTAYTATARASVVQAALSDDPAAARTALGVPPYAAVTSPLASGQGWTVSAAAAGTSWSYQAGDIARVTLATSGNVHDLQGASIERAFTLNPGARYRVRVTPRAGVHTSGVRSMVGLYLRAGTTLRAIWWSASERVIYTNTWAGAITSRGADGFALDGSDSMELRWSSEGALAYGAVGSSGLWRTLESGALDFKPTHFGVIAACDTATVATVDVSGLRIEALG